MALYRLYARRRPTLAEIQFGYGCYHYTHFTRKGGDKPPKYIRWLGNTWTVVDAQVINQRK